MSRARDTANFDPSLLADDEVSLDKLGTSGTLDVSSATLTTSTAQKQAISDGSSIEGTDIKSTGETGGSKFLREDGDNSCSWQIPIPAGMIAPFAMSSVPSGWLVCNGANNISKTTYASLFAAIGSTWGSGADSNTFKVPDLRGAYLRGIGTAPSNSDYVGPTNVGDSQDDQNASHSHTASSSSSGSTNTTGSHSHSTTLYRAHGSANTSIIGNGNGSYYSTGGGGGINANGNHSHTVTVSTSTTVSADGATEARVFNFGVQYCIKY